MSAPCLVLALLVADTLRLELRAPAEARVGAVVPITLRLTNAADRPVEAHFLGREIAFDIVVTDTSGAVVWRRLAGVTVPSILQLRVLAPGAALEWTAEWRPPSPGRYLLTGLLPSDAPEPLRSPPRPLVVE